MLGCYAVTYARPGGGGPVAANAERKALALVSVRLVQRIQSRSIGSLVYVDI